MMSSDDITKNSTESKLVAAISDPRVVRLFAEVAGQQYARGIKPRPSLIGGALSNGYDPDGAADVNRDRLRETHRARADAARSRVYGVRFRDILRESISVRSVVQGLLYFDDVSLFFGPSSAGKSAFMIDLACRVAAGQMLHGRNVLRGLVIYVAAEAGASCLSRIMAWKLHYKLEDADLPLVVVPVAIDLSQLDKVDVAALVALIKVEATTYGEPPVLVVIDTVRDVLAGGDEDKAAVISELIKVGRHIGQQLGGAHVALIHHIGKDATRGPRGTYVFMASPDVRASFERIEDVTRVETEKVRDGQTGVFCGFRCLPVDMGITDEWGAPITRVVADPCDPPVKAAKAGKLTDTEKRALEILHKLITEAGKSVVGNTRVMIPEEQWRAACKEAKLSTGKSRNAEGEAFRAARDKLAEKEIIGLRETMVWLIAVEDRHAEAIN
jgi:hypothetical protein